MSNKNGKAARSLKTLYGELAKLTALRRSTNGVSNMAMFDEDIAEIEEAISEYERGNER